MPSIPFFIGIYYIIAVRTVMLYIFLQLFTNTVGTNTLTHILEHDLLALPVVYFWTAVLLTS